MFNNLIKNKISEYIEKAKIFGEMRKAWANHVFFTREVILGIVHNTSGLNESKSRLMQNPAEMMAVFRPYIDVKSAQEIQSLFETHLSMGGDIVAASLAHNMDKVKELTVAWYENADAIARAFSKHGFSEEGVRKMMYDHLKLTLIQASQLLQENYQAAIQTFTQIQNEAEEMADYFAKALVN